MCACMRRGHGVYSYNAVNTFVRLDGRFLPQKSRLRAAIHTRGRLMDSNFVESETETSPLGPPTLVKGGEGLFTPEKDRDELAEAIEKGSIRGPRKSFTAT